jgi:threonine synthase
MDILISSNLERLLYEISGRDGSLIRELMFELQDIGIYTIPQSMIEKLDLFYGGYASEDEVISSIKKVYDSDGYLMDTHTAVGHCVYEKYTADTEDDTKTVIVSTASPFKFGKSVCKALNIDTDSLDDFAIIKKLSEEAKIDIPESIESLMYKEIIHRSSCEKDMMRKNIEDFLKV